MCFIDDFRLLGVVRNRPQGSKEVMLWDAAVLGDTRIPRQLVFDLGPHCRTLSSSVTGGSIVCDLGSNYTHPLRTDPSMQLVGIKTGGDYAEVRWSHPWPSRVLLIRSQVLSGFAPRIGTTSIIRWEDWSHFTKPIQITDLGGTRVHLVHSHLVSLYKLRMSNTLRFRVFDFSLEYMRREEDSRVIGELSEQLALVSKEILDSASYLSTSNIIFESVNTHDSVSSMSLGTLLASSGLNATPSSTLARRRNVVVGLHSVGSFARLHFARTFKSNFFQSRIFWADGWYTSCGSIQKSVSITVPTLGVDMSKSTRNFRQHGEKSNPTFPPAMCASKPLAIDLGVNNDPPLFGEYQTEPGSCSHR